MTVVNIKSVQENRDGSIEVLPSSNEVTIKPMRPSQVGKLAKIISATQKDLQSNETFKQTVTALFSDYAEGMELRDFMRGEDFNVFMLLDTVGFLLDKAPDRLNEIIVAMTGINRLHVENQDMDTYFDIIEGVLEVNDIEKIVKRIQRILDKMGKAFSFMRVNQEANNA